MKATLMAIKNNLQGNSSRVDEAENQITDLEHKKAKNNQSEQKEEKRSQKKDSISSFWDNFKWSNICRRGVPEEEKEQEIGNLSEKIVKENFPILVKEIDKQVQEVQRVPITMDERRPVPRHIIIKRPKVKDKERIFKAKEKKLVTGRLPDGREEEENG